MKLIKINPRVYMLSGYFVNQYMIRDGSGLTLIDTGLKGNYNNVLNAIQKIGYKLDSLKNILITHADGDHYGSLFELQIKSSAVSMTSALEAEAISMGMMSRPLKLVGFQRCIIKLTSKLFSSPPAIIQQIISPGQVLQVFDGLQVLDSSGHTPGHLSFFQESQSVLFSGDSIRLTANAAPKPSSGANTWDLKRAQDAFLMQMDMHPKVICAGHGVKIL
jgi:glyoxylase-like metal-dependent hydrolase (beta-lactamase superfamily II)